MIGLPVIHLHGTLAQYPKNDLCVNEKEKRYDPKFATTNLRKCIKQIRIIHEELKADPAFKTAKTLLSKAEIVAFLGFGYDEINLKRLDLRAHSLHIKKCDPKCTYYGTAYGLGRAKQNWVNNYFYGRMNLMDCRVEEILADQPILLQPPGETDYLL